MEAGRKIIVKRPNNPFFFFSAKEKIHIIKSIEEAEKETSGEIRVHLAKTSGGDIMKAAHSVFLRIGMTETKHRNGVLIFFAVKDRRFAILGDAGIHEKMGDDCWAEIASKMEKYFRNDDFAGGISHGIRMIGDALKEHFPNKAGDTNELPNDISFDK